MGFIHSVGIYRMRQFFAVLRSFFLSPLLYNFPFHPFPPTCLPSSFTSSCLLFLGLLLTLVVSKFIYNTLLRFLFSSILCTCPNQHNLFNLIVPVIVGFFNHCIISLLVNMLKFSFSLSYTGPKILLYTFLSKMFLFCLPLLVSRFLMHMLKFCLDVEKEHEYWNLECENLILARSTKST